MGLDIKRSVRPTLGSCASLPASRASPSCHCLALLGFSVVGCRLLVPRGPWACSKPSASGCRGSSVPMSSRLVSRFEVARWSVRGASLLPPHGLGRSLLLGAALNGVGAVHCLVALRRFLARRWARFGIGGSLWSPPCGARCARPAAPCEALGACPGLGLASLGVLGLSAWVGFHKFFSGVFKW
jgi:hypothetical protein